MSESEKVTNSALMLFIIGSEHVLTSPLVPTSILKIYTLSTLPKIIIPDIFQLIQDNNETDPDSNEETKTIETFCTSTPKKEVQCEECKNTSECIDCTVKRIIGRSGIARAIFC